MNTAPVYTSEHRPPVITGIAWYVTPLLAYLQSPESPMRTLPILMGHISDYRGGASSPVILYNTEQLTRSDQKMGVIARARQPDIAEVWDYSAVNCEILRHAGITARHVPLRCVGAELEKIRGFIQSATRDYDVGFCGAMSPRRRIILDELAAQGLSVHIVTSSGDERDRELARCRCILNIHYMSNYGVFESVRCEQWLAAGVPVLSEFSLDNDLRCFNVPYDALVSATVGLVQMLKQGRVVRPF